MTVLVIGQNKRHLMPCRSARDKVLARQSSGITAGVPLFKQGAVVGLVATVIDVMD